MTATKSFVDTNIFAYAADESPAAADKNKIATDIISNPPDELVVSTQVLQEFYVTVTRKLRSPLSERKAAEAVRGIAKLDVVSTDKTLVLAAAETSRTVQISLRDALIIEAARQAACARVWTEDLSHGQVIRGVTVEDPFRKCENREH